ncbi:Conserved_hypothetical protein [Hexamita inflata]|uniref:Transmembrane protein n=1 Tax=Hexamita inflata TaxID=28002 RepID=A0ABP1K2C6_9EUKA
MLSSILIIFKQLNVNSNILCKNSILVNNNQQLYCQKSNSMNNVKVQNNVYMTQKQKNIQLFIQNNITQQSVIDVRVNDMEVNTFALFGLNTFSQTVRDSIVSIAIDFQVVVGALICLKCDIEVFNSTLLFVGSGMQISGVIIQAFDSFRLQQTFVQFRLSSFNSSGLVNMIIQSLTNFSIVDCKLAGSNLQDGPNNGYIASRAEANQTLTISTFKVCVDTTPRFGNTSAIIDIIGSDEVECEICGGLKVVYGICLEDLKHGKLVNGALWCVDPFEFVDNRCVCVYGYLLNGSACVNILNAIQNMSSNIDSQQLQQIEDEISELANQINALNLSIHNSSNTFNTSQIEQQILGNYTQGDLHLQQNSTVLDWRIFNNISNVNENMSTINNNISTINGNITDLKEIISTLNEIIQQQNNVIIEFNCSKIPGNQMVNGTCVQVICPISGQQVIQGRCRCTDVNSYVSGTSCVCPYGSTLFSGVCICDNTHAYISGTSCVCPTYSSPIGNVCTCPANSQIVGTKCVCNQIQGQTMLNSATPSCTCPANSVPDNGVCVCNVISGQTLSNGACRCPIGKYVVNASCETMDIIDYNDSSISCSQSIYISTFDISAITKTVSVNNFTNGYVFNTSITLNNSFINIDDNVYGAATLPLFYNRIIFNNIKIQLGNEVLSGGQLLTTSGEAYISQMKIISKDGTTLSANLGQFNILVNSLSTSNITNLLINLSFLQSWGNISLINYTSGQINISNYQILGDYQSYGCISLISYYSYYVALKINNVNFKPNTFIAGKQSSLFFSMQVYSATFLNNITIIIGDISDPSLANQVQSNSSYFYQYGGLLTYGERTTLKVNSLIYDCFQIYKTNFVQASGLLVGSSKYLQSNITIFKMCFQQQLSSTSQQFSKFGLIGYSEGNVSIQQSSVTFIIQALQLYAFGLMGQTQLGIGCVLEVMNTTITVNTIIYSNTSQGQVAGVVGRNDFAETFYIQHVVINNSNISSANHTGGIIGWSYGWYNYAKFGIYMFQDVSVQNSIISADNNSAGGFIGCASSHNIYVSNSNIQSLQVQSNTSRSLIFAPFSTCTIFIDTSFSTGENYINGILQQNCDNWISGLSSTGC